ncbi:hypothetical protein AMTRI_Chr12g273720 [Amborella trichopoda]
MELVDTMRRRRVNTTCLHEIKWKGEKTKEIDRYDFWYTRKYNNRNEIDIIVNKYLKDEIVNLKRVGDQLVLIKLVLEEAIVNVINVYTPLDDRIKKKI